MLTAAVRDLHQLYPGQFVTDVRTPCPALWEHNPYITPLSELDPRVQVIDCVYPLIHSSNTLPYHFLHGFMDFLSKELEVDLRPTVFRGDIHLSPEERDWISQVREITGRARWFDGRTFLWLGRTKVTGKGEGWSNLKFDQIVDIPPAG